MSLHDHEDFTSRTSMMTIFGNDLILEIIGNYLELVDILSLSSVCQVISFSISNLSIWKNYYFDHLRAFQNFRSNFESNSPSKNIHSSKSSSLLLPTTLQQDSTFMEMIQNYKHELALLLKASEGKRFMREHVLLKKNMKSYIPYLPTKWISRGCTVCFVGDVYQEDTFCYLCGEPETTSVFRPFLCEKSVRIHGKDMLLLRTVCSDDYKRLRQVMYPACDLIVFCYSLRDDSLLGPLSTQLIEEIRESVRHYIPSMVLFSLNGKSQETSQEHIEALRKGGEKLAREVTNSITLVEIDISNSSKDQSRWDQERQRVIEIMYRILVLHGLTSSNKTVSRCSIC